MRQFSIRRIFKYSLGLISIFLVVALVAYYVVWPRSLAHQYLSRLQVAATELKGNYQAIAKSANEPIFNNPDLPVADKKKNLGEITALVGQTRQKLSVFSASADSLRHMPRIGPVFGSYTKAITTRDQAHDMVLQSGDVLNQTDALVNYMGRYIDLQAKFDNQLANFNSIADFNGLIGHNQFSGTATTLRQYASQLKRAQPPLDLMDFQQQTLSIFEQAATGFDHLAGGLYTGLDNQIYAATQEIEQVSQKNDDNKNGFFDAVVKSPTLKEMVDLPDKLEQFKALVKP